MQSTPDIRQALHDSHASNRTNYDSWGIHDSNIADYDATFYDLLHGRSLADLMGERAEQTGRPPVVVDLLSSPAALRSMAAVLGHQHGTTIEGISVALTDKRLTEQRNRDTMQGIQHVAGDVVQGQTRRQFRHALDGRTADLVIERGIMGLAFLPDHPQFYAFALDAIWSVLHRDGGQMFVQLHAAKFAQIGLPDSRTIAERLQHHGVEAEASSPHRPSSLEQLRVRRTPDSPARQLSSLLFDA